MSIDLVHDDVEKDLIRVRLKQSCNLLCFAVTSDNKLDIYIFFTIYFLLHCIKEVEVIKSCQERMRRHLDRAVAQLA